MLSNILDIAVVVFAVTSMFSVGVTYSLRQIIGPLRNLRLVALAVVANFVLVPAWAVLISEVLQLDQQYETGILLVASAAGAPFLVKLVSLSDGDVAFAGSMLVLLLPVTVLYMPLVVPLIAPNADVDVLAIASPLFLTNLLPLIVGAIVLLVLPLLARRVRPILGPVSTVALIAVVAFTIAANASELLDVFGRRAILAAFLLIVGAFVIGFLLGAPDDHRDEVGLATAQRNMAAATVVATQAIGDPDTIVTVVVTSVAAMVVLFPLSALLKKRFGNSGVSERGALSNKERSA